MKKIDRGVMIATIMAIGMALLSGCAGTSAAYKAADGLEETAYVMNQHYLALVREANGLADAGQLTGSALASVQDVVRDSRPWLQSLSNAARAYEAVRDAETTQALTDAIAAAAVELSNLLNAIKRAGGSRSMLDDIGADLAPLLAAA